MDGTNKIKIAGQPGVKLPAVLEFGHLKKDNSQANGSGVFSGKGLLHKYTVFTEITDSIFTA